MKRLFAIMLITIICNTGINSFAQNEKKRDPCEDAQTQSEMNDCSKKEFDKADQELNRVYKQLMARLEGEHKNKLKTAELAWIKYRDLNCECESFINEGGSIYPLVYNSCLTNMTNNRIKELKEYLAALDH
jgi:uncharacterized protein YecT (DUF1311 family)